MSKFVEAYDTKTGKKLPHLVPERHIGHPILGKRLSRLPSQKAQVETPVDTPDQTPPGEVETPVTPSGARARGAKKKED